MGDVDRTIQIASVVGLSALTVDSFNKFLPSVAEIRAAKPGSDIAANVHAGELIAGIGIMTVSMLVASMSNDGRPIVIGGIGFLAMFGVYEWLLRSPKPFE